MKKAKDIAKELGVSTATISLALNNRPGVKKETKERIIEYINSLDDQNGLNLEGYNNTAVKNIKIIIYKKHGKIIEDKANDLFIDVLKSVDRAARAAGLGVNINYFMENEDDIWELVENCTDKTLVGIFLFATEMLKNDFEPLKTLNIPIVIYDNDFEDNRCDSIILNNRLSVKMGMEYLFDQGFSDIMYFYNATTIYNFLERRDAFRLCMGARELPIRKDTMFEAGTMTEEIYNNVLKYIKDGNRMPQVIFTENFSISVGTITALKECNYRIPEDISIIGVDDLPQFFCTDINFTHIKVLHSQRGIVAMDRLIQKIMGTSKETVQISFAPEFIAGDTVKIIN